MRKFGAYLLADNRRAAIAALICTLLPLMMIPTGFIAAVIVGLVTLRKGYKSGLMVLAFILLPAISLLIAKRVGFFYDYLLMIAQSVLVWVFALVLRRTHSWKWLLEIAAVMALVGIVAIHIFVPNIDKIWINLYHQYMNSPEWSSIMRVSNAPSEQAIQVYSLIATGAIAFFILFFLFVQVLLARWWETAIVEPGLLQYEFNQIRVDRVAAVLLMIATIGMYWKLAWLMDLYPVLLFPFMIAGLSLLHSLASRRRELVLVIIAVYILLLMLPITRYIVMVLALLGFVDSWYNVRKHYLTT